MTRYQEIQNALQAAPRTWLITGVAGFIGSNLLEKLLLLGQTVVGLDNFATGKRVNLDEVRALVSAAQWSRFKFIEGDICDLKACREACAGIDYVLHQAALGSVPRSIEDPLRSHQSNVDGFLNMLVAARDAAAIRFVYASSSSVYGDHPALPKKEEIIGSVLSPYAATKLIDEIYASVFSKNYDLKTTGLRYFNVFGQRQSPDGPYAAVIPKWFAALFAGGTVEINGDGQTSRDFCYIDNVVQANILSATTQSQATCSVYNIAYGEKTTLLELYGMLCENIRRQNAEVMLTAPQYRTERKGDVRHSLADISKAVSTLGYAPKHSVVEGLRVACDWYARNR